MKKILIVLFNVFLFTACGGNGKNASKLADDVCDCYKKTNGMDAADPKKADAQNDCLKMQMENWTAIRDNQKKSDEFNKIIGACGKDMIKKSFE